MSLRAFSHNSYYLEKEAASSFGIGIAIDDDGEGIHAAFRSIPNAVWFMLVTMTTVRRPVFTYRNHYSR